MNLLFKSLNALKTASIVAVGIFVVVLVALLQYIAFVYFKPTTSAQQQDKAQVINQPVRHPESNLIEPSIVKLNSSDLSIQANKEAHQATNQKTGQEKTQLVHTANINNSETANQTVTSIVLEDLSNTPSIVQTAPAPAIPDSNNASVYSTGLSAEYNDVYFLEQRKQLYLQIDGFLTQIMHGDMNLVDAKKEVQSIKEGLTTLTDAGYIAKEDATETLNEVTMIHPIFE